MPEKTLRELQEIDRRIAEAEDRIRAFDPEGMTEARRLLPEVEWCQDAYHALEGADAAVILTEWNEFRGLDLGRARELMRRPVLIDLRNIFDPAQVAAAGFGYTSVGRPAAVGG